MSGDFETNGLLREAEGSHKAGEVCCENDEVVAAVYCENYYYYLIATSLTVMKGGILYVTKIFFH